MPMNGKLRRRWNESGCSLLQCSNSVYV